MAATRRHPVVMVGICMGFLLSGAFCTPDSGSDSGGSQDPSDAGVAGSGDFDSAAPVSPEASGAPGSLRYLLAWSWGSAVPADDGGSWRTTNDLGFEVEVTGGYLVTYSMQLVECEEADGAEGSEESEVESASLGGMWQALFGGGLARAGHAYVEDGPAVMNIPQIEGLAAPRALDLGTRYVGEARYCSAHYLVARADDETADESWPEDVDMWRIALHLEGTWRAAGDEEATPFEIRTNLGNARLDALAEALDTSTGSATLTVYRELGTLFDGVDFETEGADNDALARGVLAALIDHTELEITPGVE